MAIDHLVRSGMVLKTSHALMDASRCLGCHDAPCSQACPVGLDVPGFIRRLHDGNLQGAGALIYQSCPLGATCGMACPTGMLCEGACVLQKAGQQAVHIGALQTTVALNYKGVESAKLIEKPARVAVIGAGPAGLGCAVALRRHGHQVDLFDRQDQLAGLVDRVIPAYRLPAEIVAHDLQVLSGLKMNFFPGREITHREFETLRESYDAVFLGVGMSDTQKVDFPGSEAAGVLDALDFLHQARLHTREQAEKPDLGETVVILGGGNVALDAAVVAKRSGTAEVVVIYRRSKQEMPGWDSEYLEAARLGVEFRWLTTIAAVEQKDGKVSAVLIQKMRFVNETRGGRRWVEADPDLPPTRVPCQTVILALGQVVERDWLVDLGLKLTPTGIPVVDPETRQTSLPKVFAGGELVNGGSTIVNSLHQGMQAGESMNVMMSGKGGWHGKS